MVDPGVIVAVVLAGLCGAALLWIALFYGYKYIHRQRLEFNQFFDFIHFHLTRRCECEDHGNEKGTKDKKSRHSYKGRSQSSDNDSERPSRSRRERRGRPRSRERWPDIARRCSMGASPTPIYPQQRLYPLLPQHEYGMPLPYSMHAGMNAPMMPQMNATVAPPIAPPIAPPAAYYPGYGYACEDPSSQSDRSETEEATEATEASTATQRPSFRRVDMIQIVPEYPPMILEAIEKAEAEIEAASTQFEASSTSSTIEQIPRKHIPQPTPKAAAAAATFPQMHQGQPFGIDMGVGPPPPPKPVRFGTRYAPYVRTSGRRKLRNVGNRRLAPSNASP